MNKQIHRSWISIVLWGLILTVVLVAMPDMGTLVREKGQAEIDAKYSYSVAQNILKQFNDVDDQDHMLDIIMVYYNKDGLTRENLDAIKEKAAKLESSKDKYGVKKVLNAFTNKDLEDQVISEDGTTLLLPVSLQRQDRTVEAIREAMTSLLEVDGVECYSTGSDFIIEDFVKTVEAGVKKTELITVILIILILILVFRSPAAPFVTLATVALTYLVSLGIVLQMVERWNFTISNFTNIFLIIVLFGIGTDYTMLLLMRFKEELHKGTDKDAAIVKTYKTAGKTVILSSLTILIGFSCLALSQFKIYRSASAVAVGVAVLIVMVFTFLPAMMKLFGKYIFWSPLKSSGHADSKSWEKIASVSTKRPYFAILFVLAVCSIIYFHISSLSYDNLKEVGSDYPSVRGFNAVTEKFSVGKALPLTIAIKSGERLDNQYALSELDGITEAVKAVKGVGEVYSVTQPKGKRIEKMYINDQTAVVRDGLKEAADGADKINGGFADAIRQIEAKSVDTTALDELQKGAKDLTSGIHLVNQSVNKLKNGLINGAQASKELEAGIVSIDSSMEKLGGSMDQLQDAYTAIGQGYQQVQTGLGQLLEQTRAFQTAFGGVVTMQSQLEVQYPELAKDKTFVTMKQTCLQLGAKLQEMMEGITKLNAALTTANSSMEKTNQGLAQAQGGIAQMKGGTASLKAGGSTMSTSLAQAAAGQGKASEALGRLEEGSEKLADGQNQLIEGVNSLSRESDKLTEGLADAREGLTAISEGLKDANGYVEKLGESKTAETFFIPQDEIDSGDFTKSMDMYMTEDRTITKINVILNIDPYSKEAMDVAQDIYDTVLPRIEASTLKDAQWGISGVSQMNNDLKTMSEKDFNLSSIIMLIGISIVLFVVTRDFWMSIFIMLSLVASYYIAITVSGLVFSHVLHKGSLAWNVPFFSFIMIIALGVDYSIFLVMRHRENHHLSLTESIVAAARSVGGVIFSAAIILSGTFAAMYPSGVLTLMQLSVTVIFGILLLVLVFMPVFIPAMISVKAKIIRRFGAVED